MRSPVTLAALVAVFAFATAARAQQPPASQHGTVSQSVNTTTITLEYDRPVLRGRSIFGELLDYDVIWTPGANRATWIDFSAPVKIQGQELPAGRYGLWTIPQERRPLADHLRERVGRAPLVLLARHRGNARRGPRGAGRAHGGAGLLLSGGRAVRDNVALSLGRSCRAAPDRGGALRLPVRRGPLTAGSDR